MSKDRQKRSGPGFSHLDEGGRASMVDVSRKPVTRRVAGASCLVLMAQEVLEGLDEMPKGDALCLARAAGIMAAKRVDQLVPLAHPLPLDHAEVAFEVQPGGLRVVSEVVTTARTGAEMEALAACSAAALTLYDMVKAVQKDVVITDLRLEHKSGGRGGAYRRRDHDSPSEATGPADPSPSAEIENRTGSVPETRR